MQHYLMLSRGNFYAEKQHSNKVLQFGARGSGNYVSACIVSDDMTNAVVCGNSLERGLETRIIVVQRQESHQTSKSAFSSVFTGYFW